MKDSGIEWIGEIPEDWKIKKIFWNFSEIKSGSTPNTRNDDFYESQDIPWIVSGDLKDSEIHSPRKFISKKAMEQIPNLRLFPANTLFIAMIGATVGKVGIIKFPATSNQNCLGMYGTKTIDEKFLFYWLIANREPLIISANGGAQSIMNADFIKNIRLFSPELIEQKQISKFLDKETSKINLEISKNQKIIELLIEKRFNVITQAVTKGLDHAVTMKNSGIDWIGKIPEHWKIGKLKNIGDMSAGGTPSRSVDAFWENGTIPWISSGEIKFNIINDSSEKITPEGLLNSSTKLFPKGTVLLAITGEGATRGRSAILGIDATTNQSVVGIRVKQNLIHINFLWYYLQKDYLHLRNYSHGSVQSGLNLEILSSYQISFPDSISEQKQIIDYLDKQTSIIDSLIINIKSQIQKLQEFCQSLISFAVTGKINLKNYPISV